MINIDKVKGRKLLNDQPDLEVECLIMFILIFYLVDTGLDGLCRRSPCETLLD